MKRNIKELLIHDELSPAEEKLLRSLAFLAGKITALSNCVEHISGKIPELLVTALYAIAHMVMCIYHEPWYDEAVAWQIARCASLPKILFEIPHYEGHPPLWHLILLPFAKLGAPYELSLSVVSLIFAGAAVGLIIWKSPFPRIVRLLLPFTYFFFYQYGVISRPYCVMMLAFMLLALSYHGRNEHPGRYVLSLMLLCLTSAYGIVIAGGLAMVWVWEIWDRQNILKWVKTFLKDKRIWWLAALLALALCLIAEIMPRSDTYATNLQAVPRNSFAFCLIYLLFSLPSDISFTSALSSPGFLRSLDLSIPSLLSSAFIGLLLWGAAFIWSKHRRTFCVLLIPYLLFAGFSAYVYVSSHHFGIVLLLAIFWLWVTCNADVPKPFAPLFSSRDLSALQNGLLLIGALALTVSLYWNISSCILDFRIPYAAGREEAAFLTEYDLQNRHILVAWETHYKDDILVHQDINHCFHSDNMNAYFNHNLFFNFNGGDEHTAYTTHRIPTDAETKHAQSLWREITPEVLFMHPDLKQIYGDTVTIDDYTLVYDETGGMIWKGTLSPYQAQIHVRNDIAQELGLEEVQQKFIFTPVN